MSDYPPPPPPGGYPPPPPPDPGEGPWPQLPQQPWPQQTPYGQPPPSRSTNGLAIASMVLGIVWVWWVGSLLALIFGYIALRQIKRSNGWQQGRGMAIAGVVLGWVGVGTLVLFVVLAIAAANDDDLDLDSDDSYGDDADLDLLWDRCDAGNMRACDNLYAESPVGSEYEEFGDTCGRRAASSDALCEGRVDP